MLWQRIQSPLAAWSFLVVASLPAAAVDPLAQRFCDALHTLPEARKGQCCGTAPSSSLAGECAATVSAALHDQLIRLDQGAVDRCVQQSSQELAGCDWVTPLMPRTPEACGGAIQGARTTGMSCRSSLECQDGLFCRGGGPSAAGVCAAPGAPRTACGRGVDQLASYTRETSLDVRHPECAGYCLAGRCAAFSPLGGACNSSRQCAPGQHCGEGICRESPQPAIGEACTGTLCGADAFCKEGHCASLKAAGESCSSPFECKAACLTRAGAKTGTCGMKCTDWPLPPTSAQTPSGAQGNE